MVADRPRLLRRLGSVRARTTLVASLVVGAALAVAAIGLVSLVQRTLMSNLDQSAQVRARDLAAQIRQQSLPSSPAVSDDENAVVQVFRGSRVIASSSNVRGDPPLWSGSPGETGTRFATIDPPVGDGQDYRAAAVRVGADTVVVALSQEQADDTVRTVTQVLLVGTPVLLLLVAVITWLVTGRALRPVEQIRREVANITGSALDRRVGAPGTADEVDRLARTMNDMLERLEQADQRQRRFVGDASHELRSPLAAARTELEVALAHPGITPWAETGEEVLTELVRMQRLVQDLLFLARLGEDNSLPGTRRVSLIEIVSDEVDRASGARPGVDIEVQLADVEVWGRPGDLARLVRNLLENGTRHARSRVTVDLEVVGARARLVIEDDGEGIPETEREVVFERFTRLDPGRGRDEGGTGLGLAIARDVAVAHGGSISVTQEGSGARIVVDLPAAGPG